MSERNRPGKASVRKVDGQWRTVRPAYGFGLPHETAHRRWEDALDAALGRSRGRSGYGNMTALHAELADPWHDGIAARPAWSPLYHSGGASPPRGRSVP
ncbi:hypothetical protein [Amycolatopsis thermophila]|uniref:Uncharacterized protein n=1 Tax=Amycolatopsis thermophila TaxID=206084 RepID=A0ABU0EMU9_9PSEU|nr:hypothetical protein [Amycolatopsis thermophila]MDQ0376603.1 hypothetical protein [Amycolatopsis thermophila]